MKQDKIYSRADHQDVWWFSGMIGWGFMDSVQDADAVHRLLLFSIGGGLYATHVSFIREIVADQKKVPLPNVPDYIPGVINLRSEVVKVIDIRKIIPLDVESEKKKVIVFIPETETATRFGMVVDDVHGIMEVPDHVVSHLDSHADHVQNNFMLGFFSFSLDGFLHQNNRKYAAGDDQVVWIDFEDMILTIVDEKKAGDIVFRLTALFNPDYLFSDMWRAEEKKKRVL